MMTEISLNVLDVAENSVSAGATVIEIGIIVDTKADRMTIEIKDNGKGMTKEQVEKVTDPFYTTRTTRRVGLGVPFFKQAAESTGGSFRIESEIGKGTSVKAEFILSSIDRMPLGDISSTVYTLITMHEDRDIVYRYQVDERGYELTTKEMRGILGDGVSFKEPEISEYIKEFLEENKKEIDNGKLI